MGFEDEEVRGGGGGGGGGRGLRSWGNTWNGVGGGRAGENEVAYGWDLRGFDDDGLAPFGSCSISHGIS